MKVHVKSGLLGTEGRVSFEIRRKRITARELVISQEHRLPSRGLVSVFVDGEELPAERFDDPIPNDAEVVVAPVPGGGLDLIGYLIVTLITTAVSVAVNYVVSLLAPRPQPPGVSAERGDERSPTYSWDGVQTNYGQGFPVPFVYGRHAVGGQVIYTDVFATSAAGQLSEQLRIALALSEGPIARIGDLAADEADGLGGWSGLPSSGGTIPDHIRINNNLLDSSNPLPGARVYLRPGSLFQNPLPSNPFRGATTTFTVNERLDDSGAEAIFTVSSGDEITTIAFTLAFPSGLYRQDPQGNLFAAPVSFQVQWRPVGETGWRGFFQPGTTVPINIRTFGTQASLAPIVESFGGDLQSGGIAFTGPIEVRLLRTTPRGGTDTISQSIWRQVGVNFAPLFAYPRVALLGLEILATGRLAGALPQILVRIDGILVRVWDAVNGFSDRTWDVPAAPFDFMTNPPGRNPAWILGDFLTSPWGLGSWLDDDDVDWESLRRWSIFCDADPNPSTPWGEAAFFCDLVGDSPKSAWDVVLAICAAGRATPVIRGKKIGVVYQYRDAHSDVSVSVPAKASTQTFTSANVEGLQVTWLPKHQRPTAIQFQFLNETKLYAQDVLTVEDQESNLNNQATVLPDEWRPEVVQAYGVTRENQLLREGWFIHRLNRLVRREVSFETGPWSLAAEVGDLIDVEHDVLRPFSSDVPVAQNVLVGGVSTTTVTVDHPVSGTGLELVVRNPSGAPERADISGTTPVAGGTQLTLSTTVTVDAGAPCAVGKKDKITQTYEVVAISLQKDLKRQVRALQWVPEVYDVLDPAIASDPGLDGAPETPDPDLSPSVSDLRIVPLRDGNHLVTWASPPNRKDAIARVYARNPELGVWYYLGESRTDSLAHPHFAAFETYEVSVVLENLQSGVRLPEDGTRTTFAADEFPPFAPPRIHNPRVDDLPDGLLVRWEPLDPNEVSAYEVRIGSDWVTGVRVYRGKLPQAKIDAVPTGKDWTKTIAPTVLESSVALSGTIADIDEPVDSPDTNWLTAPATNKDTSARVSFPIPSPTTVPIGGTQKFRAWVRRTMTGEGGASLTAKLELWENGVLVRSGSATEVTSTSGELRELSWSPSELLDPTGAGAECRVVGTTDTADTVEIGAVEWEANVPQPIAIQIAPRSRSGLYGDRQLVEHAWTNAELATEVELDELDGDAPGGTHSSTAWDAASRTIGLSGDDLTGTYTGEVVDAGYQGPFLWLVDVGGEEIDGATIDDWTFEIDSGEAHWRTVNTRPGSPAAPGANWETTIDDLAVAIDDLPADLLWQGFRGEPGFHTIAKVESRFWVDGAWGEWSEHENGVRVAQKIQVRVFLGRETATYSRSIDRFTVEALI